MIKVNGYLLTLIVAVLIQLQVGCDEALVYRSPVQEDSQNSRTLTSEQESDSDQNTKEGQTNTGSINSVDPQSSSNISDTQTTETQQSTAGSAPKQSAQQGEIIKVTLCGSDYNLKYLSGNASECKYTVSATPANFSVGTQDINNNSTIVAIDPGSYRALSLGPDTTIQFKSGNYYFDTVAIGANSKLEFNALASDIKIYVKGTIAIGSNTTTNIINGGVDNVCLELQDTVSLSNNVNIKGSILAFGDYVTSSNVSRNGKTWAKSYNLGSYNTFSCK